MKKSIILLIFLLILPFAYAKEYHLPLLAVKETLNGFVGSSADLFLELKGGDGRVFLDTYPLTKLDTQMSTRFAKEIACAKKNYNCNSYDFIYTIKSEAVIIGGPSAGAATTLLTIAALENLKINDNIAITGTINSGGLIGAVGGLKEKIDAASEMGLKTVLIPHGEKIAELDNVTLAEYVINVSTDNKSTIDLIKYGKHKDINVIEVATINEALYYITGKEISYSNKTLEIDPTYIETMQGVTENLCNKSLKFIQGLSKYDLDEKDKEIFDKALNLTDRYKTTIEKEKYYSAASYCFGANTKLSFLTLKLQDLDDKTIFKKTTEIKSLIKKTHDLIDEKELKTITDLETYMIVKERLIEAEENINKVVNTKNKTEKISYLSYGAERLNSALSWFSFFDTGEKEFIINKEELKNSCINKIYEAEERYQYLILLTSASFSETKQEIELAKKDLEDENYELCLFKASKAKANSDVILNTVGIEESDLNYVNEKRLEVIKNNIIKGQQNGVFPVIGYSYYEYAEDLKEKDIFSSMLFAEYSLELSNLDIYFKEDNNEINLRIDEEDLIRFIIVFILGLILGILIEKIKMSIKPRRLPKERSGKKR